MIPGNHAARRAVVARKTRCDYLLQNYFNAIYFQHTFLAGTYRILVRPEHEKHFDVMTKSKGSSSTGDSQKNIAKKSSDWKLELLALIGFCVSGMMFVVAGLRSGEIFTILASLVWTVSCVVWMIPYRKYFHSAE
jgi:hypothetical protein